MDRVVPLLILIFILRATMKLKITNFACIESKEYFTDIVCRLRPARNKTASISFYGNSLQDIRNLEILLKLFQKFNHFEVLPVNLKASGCKALPGKTLNPLMNEVSEFIISSSNLNNVTCPVKPQKIIFENLRLDSTFSNHLPSIFPNRLFRANAHFVEKLTNKNFH